MFRWLGLLSRPDGGRLSRHRRLPHRAAAPNGEQVLTLVPGTNCGQSHVGGGNPLPAVRAEAAQPALPAPAAPPPARFTPALIPPLPVPSAPPKDIAKAQPAARARSAPRRRFQRVGPKPAPPAACGSHPVSRRLVLPPERRPETPIPRLRPGRRHKRRSGKPATSARRKSRMPSPR